MIPKTDRSKTYKLVHKRETIHYPMGILRWASHRTYVCRIFKKSFIGIGWVEIDKAINPDKHLLKWLIMDYAIKRENIILEGFTDPTKFLDDVFKEVSN